MPLYFLVHDAAPFHQAVRPALSQAWRCRSFEPCRPLCQALAPAALSFAELYHTGPEESLLAQLARSPRPFDRDLWRLLVGEVLLFGAVAVPEFQTAPETLAWLLAPGQEASPIHQAHFGSRKLVLGGFYRPDAAGWNDAADVARLAEYMSGVDVYDWTVARLAGLPEFADGDDRVAELDFARDVFDSLRELYQAAREAKQVVICEQL
jgi:hypothetical protein